MSWIALKDGKPGRFQSVLLWARLPNEPAPDSHEGYLVSPGQWRSVRRTEEGEPVKLLDPTHWMPRPEGPEGSGGTKS